MSDSKPEYPLPGLKLVSRKMVNPMAAWAERTALVKRELEAERNASDVKTARLRALRLAKEATDADAEPPEKPPKPPGSSPRTRIARVS